MFLRSNDPILIRMLQYSTRGNNPPIRKMFLQPGSFSDQNGFFNQNGSIQLAIIQSFCEFISAITYYPFYQNRTNSENIEMVFPSALYPVRYPHEVDRSGRPVSDPHEGDRRG